MSICSRLSGVSWVKVNSSGLTPMKKKIEALQKFPPPTKQKELLAFLGTLNYFRASLPQLRPEDSVDKTMPERSPAAVLDPLYKLATCNLKKQKGNYFSDIWNKHPHLSDFFEDAKTLLVKAVTLEFPIPSAPLALSTDTSKTCLGASLDKWINGHGGVSAFGQKPSNLHTNATKPTSEN